MDINKVPKCSVVDGRFVEPCTALSINVDNETPGFSKRKGIAMWRLTNRDTWEPSRTYFGVKSSEHPNGFLFNFCPFCGVQIDAPFAALEEYAALTPPLPLVGE